VRLPDPTVPIIDCLSMVWPGGVGASMPIPREAFRDDESLAAWPSTGIVSYLFKGVKERADLANDPRKVVEQYDRWNIAAGLTLVAMDDMAPVTEALAEVSDRFLIGVRANPHDGMRGVRRLEQLVHDYPQIKACSISPHMLWPPLPPNSKEYYPLYAKCVELDLPVYINVGSPGPRVLGDCQNPAYLDEVCWFFPDLKVVMKHGGEPWADMCVKLMLKWPNLYFATSAFAPKYYPPEIIQYANTRGTDKVMFAGYWPNLAYDDVFAQLEALPLREHVWPAFLHDNAARVFRVGD
jgi:predicted TIM-barrel fold metal-dependent hydrolase